MTDILRTPQQIAERINAASGAHITARAVWEKARRLGVARKIGRAMLVSVDDIPLLLKEETKTKRPVLTGAQALSALHRARRARGVANR
ncbi:hypothetical protein [Rhizobium sp. BK379]|uniref:hypothetical protein n=1 Tax=Rhizobium sp. BK379 TaxID=2587059 RepID=UPI00160DE473|nr:hypothetical protein [Rhizobium sp. BK379]MBB3444233.1 hypothetical protein [Rhizobium sp. BK379]